MLGTSKLITQQQTFWNPPTGCKKITEINQIIKKIFASENSKIPFQL